MTRPDPTASTTAAIAVRPPMVTTLRTRRARNRGPSSSAYAAERVGKSASEKVIAITWTGTNW
jgi:hypothetical protein